jgi:fructose-bisphosphate aldolase, class II
MENSSSKNSHWRREEVILTKNSGNGTAAISRREIMQRAQAEGWAVGGFNMHNPETTQALLRAAEISQSPVFMQIGRAIIPHMGLKAAFEMTKRITDESDAAFIIHLDHGSEEEVIEAINLGFKSIMFDGAHYSLDENIRVTKEIVKRCHDNDVYVEAELGKIPDVGQKVDWKDYYTDVNEAERYANETGIDSLAISCGIVHGVIPDLAPEPLALDVVHAIRKVVSIPLVMHGASGVPDEEIQAVIEAGVSKINADTDLRFAFRKGIEDTWARGDAQLEVALANGREYMVEATARKMILFGSAGKGTIYPRYSSDAGRSW